MRIPVYVATRYSNREKGALSAGFLLALASVKVFAELGATVWDLGQTDSNPLMVSKTSLFGFVLIVGCKAYKSVVAHVVSRPVAMRRFWQLQERSAISIKRGEIVGNLREEDLMKE